MTDPTQQRFDLWNHEAGHAAAMFLFGRPIKEIDVDRPDQWSQGHVVPGERYQPQMPDNMPDPHGWVDAHLSKSLRESAIISRIGSLVGHQDWFGAESRADRANVLAACPAALSTDAWEMLVQSYAEDLRDEPRFKAVHRALSFALAENPHTVMTGQRVVEIATEALAKLTDDEG